MKEFIKDYLNFSRSERNAAIVLLILIAFVFSLPYWYKPAPVKVSKEMKEWVLETEQKLAAAKDTPVNNIVSSETNVAFFPFNPNTLDAAGFARLGIKQKTINTILNYRNKGGKFYKPDDFRKIYGLSTEMANQLVPFIQLDNTAPGYKKNEQTQNKQKHTIIDINTATETEWEALPGIGEVLAKRIISFREKLGGFYTVNQLKEVYGLSESTYGSIEPCLKVEHTSLRTININTASEELLASHPYINASLAKNILAYRTRNKSIQQIQELLVMNVIKEELYQKLSHYLTTK